MISDNFDTKCHVAIPIVDKSKDAFCDNDKYVPMDNYRSTIIADNAPHWYKNIRKYIYS